MYIIIGNGSHHISTHMLYAAYMYFVHIVNKHLFWWFKLNQFSKVFIGQICCNLIYVSHIIIYKYISIWSIIILWAYIEQLKIPSTGKTKGEFNYLHNSNKTRLDTLGCNQLFYRHLKSRIIYQRCIIFYRKPSVGTNEPCFHSLVIIVIIMNVMHTTLMGIWLSHMIYYNIDFHK